MIRRPQRCPRLIDLTKFQPGRLIKVSTQASVSSTPSVLSFGASTPPAASTEIPALTALRGSFNSSRLVSMNIMFDQRGSTSTGAVPRVTAFALNQGESGIDPAKLINPATFAGSGLNQIMPGRPFRVPINPRFPCGQFNSNQSSSLVLVGQDYQGTVRIDTTFEVLGPPLDLSIGEELNYAEQAELEEQEEI